MMIDTSPSNTPFPGAGNDLSRVRSYSQEVTSQLDQINNIAWDTIGSPSYDGLQYSVLACAIRQPGPTRLPWVLISAGVHGDEVAGVFAAIEFLKTRATKQAQNYHLAILPCVNPSGFECDTLETANGANINRLFGTASMQAEVRAVELWLKRLNVQFLATFDLHEVAPDYRGEGFVESDNPQGCYLYETLIDKSRRIGRRLIDELPPDLDVCRWPTIYRDRNDGGLISYPEACHNAVYAEKTSFDAYLNGNFTEHSFTLETPMHWSLATRVRTHLLWLDMALEFLKPDYTIG